MSGSTIIGKTAKLSPRSFRTIGRFFEILTMGSLGAGLLLLSYDSWYLFWFGLFAFVTGVVAYLCARRATLEKSKTSVIEKPFCIEDRYLIDVTSLEKMTVDGVPWDVVGALTALNNFDLSSPPGEKPTGMTEVELIQQLVSLRCDLERINEFRRKILKNTRVENTINFSHPSNSPSSDSAPVTSASTLEPAPAVRAPSS